MRLGQKPMATVVCLLVAAGASCGSDERTNDPSAAGTAGTSGSSGAQGGAGASESASPAGTSGGAGGGSGGDGTDGIVGGPLPRGQDPSGGPGPCGCKADQICVTWEQTGRTDCWTPPTECVRPISCSCFDPCNPARTGAPFCVDRTKNPANPIGWADQDLQCIQGRT